MKGLMLFSQVLLLIFAAQWLMSQYNEQQTQLKSNLTDLFIDVQERVADSLIFTNLADTAAINKAELVYLTSTNTDNKKRIKPTSAQVHRLLGGMRSSVSREDEKKLFRLDTITFNEIFSGKMKEYGWDFNSRWINSADSQKEAKTAIFIQSKFFTNANGVVIRNYDGYLLKKIFPQIVFALILLSLTATAFWMTFRSLKSQIKLSELKDDFISNMSHELKTPIATVKVALEALNHDNIIDNPTLNREYLGMVTSEMDRLELLATRVLNTSQLESGKIYLQQENYDLKRLVEEVLAAMQLRMAHQNARVSFNVSGSNFLIRMDKLHMQGVLINLLDNSLKYGVAPVNILIDLCESNGAIKLAFSDNGPGIPEEYKEKVFEKFFRVPTGNRHNTKGFGLGLSYAAQVMRQHNGSINVNNIEEGGCVFTLTF